MHGRQTGIMLWLCVLCGLWFVPAVWADGSGSQAEPGPLPVEMRQTLHDPQVYPGDPIRLEVRFESDRAFSAEVLGSLPLGKFELKRRERRRDDTGGRFAVVHQFELLAFTPDDYETPRILFVITQDGRQEERSLDARRVTVRSLLEEEARKIARQQAQGAARTGPAPGAQIVQPGAAPPTLVLPGAPDEPPAPGQPPVPGQPDGPEAVEVSLEPRDIKQPVAVWRENYTPAYIVAALLALLLAGLLLRWWLKRPGPVQDDTPAEPVDTRPAHVVALARLDELERRQFVAKRQIKAYHLELSEILRDYFKRRYALDVALSMTSSEIVERLKTLYLRDLDDRAVAELMLAGDLVKFAKDEPADAVCHERLAQARLIVERTREDNLGVR